MIDIIPAAERGRARIEHVDAGDGFITCQLWIDGKCVMNDLPAQEAQVNRPLIEAARGDVLITGLGIGYVLLPIFEKPDVHTVTVIEECQDVIDLVLPYIAHPKLTVILGSAFEWLPERTYDSMWFDIYPHTEQIGAALIERFAPYLRPGLGEIDLLIERLASEETEVGLGELTQPCEVWQTCQIVPSEPASQRGRVLDIRSRGIQIPVTPASSGPPSSSDGNRPCIWPPRTDFPRMS